jgi:hypothetical protein
VEDTQREAAADGRSPAGAPPRLLYIHIYKCGGTTMRRHISDHLVAPGTTFVDQWAYAWERDIDPPDRLLGNLVRAELLRLGPLAAPSGPTVVLTHCFFYEWMKGLPGFRFVTLLRDPVARLVSQFDFQRRELGMHAGEDRLAWLRAQPSYVFNLQTAALCGCPAESLGREHLELAKANLHCFDVLGFVERFPEALALFDRTFGLGEVPPPPRLNVSPGPPAVLDDATRDLLVERSTLDRELCAYAARLVQAKVAAHELLATGDPETAPPSVPTRHPEGRSPR